MKKKYQKLLIGFFIGVIISAVSNLITLGSLQPLNIIVGGVLGIIVYYFFHRNLKGFY